MTASIDASESNLAPDRRVGKMIADNRLVLQAFEWHSEPGHYARLTRILPTLAGLGVTTLWLPPGCKANNSQGNGYDLYDLFDLGEFEQKGNRATKWGSKEELEELLAAGRECEIEMIWDAVLNHKAGADGIEECWAVEVDPEDRRYEICAPRKIEAWLRYEFHGRELDGELKYSSSRWRPEHFNGVDWDQRTQGKAVYKLIDDPSTTSEQFRPPKRPFLSGHVSPSSSRRRSSCFFSRSSKTVQRPGKGWASDVDTEHGNYDYLMCCNIDYTNKEVREDVCNWGRWMIEDVGVDGFRLDAARHFSSAFARHWIQHVQNKSQAKRQKGVFVIGEVWTGERSPILDWLDAVQSPAGPQVYAYDSPLLYNFSHISEAAEMQKADLRNITRGSLLEARPNAAVTLVTNHDTQPGQAAYAPMSKWLKPLFYAFVLLRKEGTPCVFWGDLYGTNGPHAERPPFARIGQPNVLEKLMLCRKLFAHGEQTDVVCSAKDVLAWTRSGSPDHPGGCAVLICVGNNPKRCYSISMDVKGEPGEVWVNVLSSGDKRVVIDDTGKGSFRVFAEEVAVYARRDDGRRKMLRFKSDGDAVC